MTALTLKILAGVLQMNAPDATLTSDNQGLRLLLADVKEQLAEEADTAAANGSGAVEAHVLTSDGGIILAKKNSGGFGKATTIFRKGDYGRWVGYKRIDL